MKFNRSGRAEKVYAKLEADLRQMIYHNELSFTEPLNGEIKLAEAYDISRESVRKALRNLVAEGLVRKVNGHGTFVVPPDQRRNGVDKRLSVLLFGPGSFLENPPGAYERELLAGFDEHARRDGHRHTVADYDGYSEETVLKDFDALRFDAIIWDRPPEDFAERIHRLQARGVPQLTLNTPIPSIPFIEMDFERSMIDILYFLTTLGHRDVMFVDESKVKYQERYDGRRDVFVEALRGSGHTDPETMYLRVPEGVSHRDKAWKRITKASAVILANIGCYRKFKLFAESKGLKVPDDMTVVVHLDHDELRRDDVCAYSHDRHETGRRAFTIVKKIVRREMVPQRITINGNLIVRRSYARGS